MMTWLGTGRVWSLEMMTQFFFPLAKSLSFGLPIGLARHRRRVPLLISALYIRERWETRTPATCSSGSSSLIFFFAKRQGKCMHSTTSFLGSLLFI